jgi:hypothetical protein
MRSDKGCGYSVILKRQNVLAIEETSKGCPAVENWLQTNQCLGRIKESL